MTKKQIAERDGKAALSKRLIDIASGAYGAYEPLDLTGEESGSLASDLGIDAFGRFLGGVANRMLPDDQKSFIEPRYFNHWDTIATAVEFLWDRGVRA